MIIIRYFLLETLKSQSVILFVLLLIFFFQKLVKILSETVEGKIPTNLVLSLLGLEIPEITQLIFPLSLAIALIMTLEKLHSWGEIIVMHACGLSKSILLNIAMILAFFTGIIALVNTMWIVPFSSRHQNEILEKNKVNPGVVMLAKKQFQKISNKDSILFIEEISGNNFYNIFFSQQNPKGNNNLSIITAKSGKLELHKNGYQTIILNRGILFESKTIPEDFRITHFQNYQIVIGNQKTSVDLSNTKQMYIHTLWNTNTNYARIELHWRITLIFIIFIMALMVIPLSRINFFYKRILPILSTLLLYLAFFLLQTLIKSNAEKGKIDPIFWIWFVNGIYFLLAIILNFLDIFLTFNVKAIFFLSKRKI